MRYNPPPTWPSPPPGWQPPAEWGPPPPGWQFWVEDRPPRPSVWSTIGIAVASAFVIGIALGLVFAPEGANTSYWVGRGVGRVLLPAIVIGAIWPHAVPRVSRWFVPTVVLVTGVTLAVLLNAADAGAGRAMLTPG